MKRIVATIVLFGLLGAATSVSIAWWLALREHKWEVTRAIADGGWFGNEWRDRGASAINLLGVDSDHPWFRPLPPPDPGSPTTLPPWCSVQPGPADDSVRAFQIAAGWPCLCVRGEMASGDGSTIHLWLGSFDRTARLKPQYLAVHESGIVQGRSPFDTGDEPDLRILPVGPVWRGLMMNSLLFGATWWLVLMGLPCAARWALMCARKRSGRCPTCRYDRRHDFDGLCTECGNGSSVRPRLITGGLLSIAAVVLTGGIIAGGVFVAVFASDPPYRPIHVAAWEGDVDGVRRELRNGQDIDEPCDVMGGDTPLGLAVRLRRESVVRALIEAGASVDLRDRYGNTPLHSVMSGCPPIDIALILLEAGADANAAGLGGRTALHITARDWEFCGASDELVRLIVELLVQYGADLDALTGTGYTVLLDVVSDGLAGPARILLEAGADPNLGREIMDRPPLHVAIYEDRVDLTRLLLKFGADPDLTDGDARTALTAAVDLNKPDLVRILLELGADPTIPDADGRLPLDIARARRSFAESQRLLEEAIERRRSEQVDP